MYSQLKSCLRFRVGFKLNLGHSARKIVIIDIIFKATTKSSLQSGLFCYQKIVFECKAKLQITKLRRNFTRHEIRNSRSEADLANQTKTSIIIAEYKNNNGKYIN